MATSKPRVMLYLSPELDADIRRDAAMRGQSLAVWFQRAAGLALSPIGRKVFIVADAKAADRGRPKLIGRNKPSRA